MAKMGLSKVAIRETANRYRTQLETTIARHSLFKLGTKLYRGAAEQGDDTVLITPEELVRHFSVHVDPDKKGRYTKWLVARFIAYDPRMISCWRLNPNDDQLTARLQRYDQIKPFLPVEFRDIQRFSSIRQFYDFLESLAEHDFKSVRQADRDYESELFKNGEAKLVHEDQHCKVLHICSLDAAMHFGRNTKWCVTSPTATHFANYATSSHLFYILLKGSSERYAYAMDRFAGRHLEFRNSANIVLGFRDTMSLYPDALAALDAYGKTIITPAPKKKAGISELVLYDMDHVRSIRELARRYDTAFFTAMQRTARLAPEPISWLDRLQEADRIINIRSTDRSLRAPTTQPLRTTEFRWFIDEFSPVPEASTDDVAEG